MGTISILSDGTRTDRLADVAEAARLLGISPAVLRLEVARGNLKPSRAGRRFVLTRTEIDAYRARHQEQALLECLQVLPSGRASGSKVD
jgi:hypothetical protein